MTLFQSYKSTNLLFAVRAKPELPELVQSILQNYKCGIICKFTGLKTSTQFDQETVTMILELSGLKGALSVHFQLKV